MLGENFSCSPASRQHSLLFAIIILTCHACVYASVCATQYAYDCVCVSACLCLSVCLPRCLVYLQTP